MDPTFGVPTTKMLDTVKSLPTWLLVGLSIFLLAILLWPPFLLGLPEVMRPSVPVALLLVTTLTICNLLSLWFAHVAERQRRSRAGDLDRLVHLYRPLKALFLTRHPTVCTGIGSPYLRQRIENAWAALGAYGRLSRRVKRALRALFDKQRSSSAEIEYGGSFPMSEIIKIVRAKVRYANPELHDLVNQADRSRYEEYDNILMTDAEYALLEHIDREHRSLSKRVG
ncbi:hypothetical protein RPMA_03850 [Tardiphaga alba]|uniref:DUF4129 domain-containing protein n=1 Tax=Tardiphaga alba TaxID=340268 RepID=A0ABX8A3F1_9BRAD|nr:hypothetical protein [Tardiphaga alba]QUS38083.1 hypothetical protein RPMA_03850 [Tardiphaga alba]